MKKKSATLGSVFLIGTLLTGCSSQSATNGSAGSNNSKVVTLTFWNRYPELDDSLTTFVQGFEKTHPDIKIELQNLPTSTATAQYQTAVSNNDLPDIFTTGTPTLQQLVQLNQVHSLNTLFPANVKNEYVNGSWVNGLTTLNGNTYVLPLYSPNQGSLMMYYNKDVLSKYGIKQSQLPKTWDQLMDLGETIYSKSHGQVYGLIGSNEDWMLAGIAHPMATAISPNTPTTFNYKTGRPDFNTQGDIETIQFYKSMLNNHVLDPNTLEISEPQSVALFAAGKAAFLFSGDYEGANIINTAQFTDWGVASLPTKNGEPFYRVASGGNGIEVSENTKHWPQVETFLKYCINNIYSQAILQPAAAVPAKIGVKGTPAFPQFTQEEEIDNKSSIVIPNPNQRNTATIQFMNDYGDELKQTDIGDVMLGYLTGQVKNISSALSQLNDQANTAFNETLKKDKNVNANDFIFPNWKPFTPYSNEDYSQLSK